MPPSARALRGFRARYLTRKGSRLAVELVVEVDRSGFLSSRSEKRRSDERRWAKAESRRVQRIRRDTHERAESDNPVGDPPSSRASKRCVCSA